MDHDVRDLRGRFRRLRIAALVGIAGSLAITYILPTRDHFPYWLRGCMRGKEGWFVEGGDPVLILAGAILLALACYHVLALLHRRAPAKLPRAIVYRANAA